MNTLLTLAYGPFHGGRSGVALLGLRMFVGVAFVLHGLGHLNAIGAFAGAWNLPYGIALAAKLTQFIGGGLLIVGLLTPVAAFGISTTMVVAIPLLIGRGETFINPRGHSWEACAFYAVTGVAIALLGPGRYSIDARLFRRPRP